MAKCKHPKWSTRISAGKAAAAIGGKARPVKCDSCGKWKVVAS